MIDIEREREKRDKTGRTMMIKMVSILFIKIEHLLISFF